MLLKFYRVLTISPNVTVGSESLEDGAVTNAKVAANAAIAWSKMAALTEGSILLGNASNVATVTDAKTDTQILVGNATTLASVAVSGDATLANTGALTIATDAITTGKILAANVTEAKIATDSLTAIVAANVADANATGGIQLLFRIDTAGGATANTDVTMTHKVRVIDAWVVNRAAGTAGDTITVSNTASAITDAIDISPGDKTIARAGEIDDANHEIAASGVLRITETDGGGNDSPATTVYVLAVKVA